MGRYFAGIKIPLTPGEKLVKLEKELAPLVPARRWYGPEQFHITANFLGELDEDGKSRAIGCLREVAANHSSFELSLNGVGAFPNARVVWCGVAGETDRLAALQKELGQAFRPLGADRFAKPQFIPHITLARTGDIRSFRPESVDAGAILDGTAWRVDRVCLFESVPDPKGARYPVVYEVLLQAKRD